MARLKQGIRPRKNAPDRTPLDIGAADNITLVRYARLGVRKSSTRLRKSPRKKR